MLELELYSPATGKPIESQTASDMISKIKELPLGTKIYILAPIVRGHKGEYRKELHDIRKKGFQRLRIDNEVFEVDDLPTIDKNKKHHIEVLVDRILLSDDLGNRLADSVETALKLANGLLYVEITELPESYKGEELENGKNINLFRKIFLPSFKFFN